MHYKNQQRVWRHAFVRKPVQVLATVLAMIMLINTFYMLDLTGLSGWFAGANPADYHTPTEKLATIDAGTTIEGYTAWYTGYDNGVLIDRYSGYTQAGNTLPNLGSESEPYIIKTGLELSYLAALVNGSMIADPTFTGKHIELEGSVASDTQTEKVIDLILAGGYMYQKDDISYTYTVSAADYSNNYAFPSWLGWVDCTETNNNHYGWTPIGNTAAKYFNGHLYAADAATGINIYNLNYGNGGNSTEKAGWENNAYVGLFGHLGSQAVVEGLHIVDAQLFTRGSTYVGTLAGAADIGASVKNCTSAGLQTASSGLSGGLRTKNALGQTVWASGYTVPDYTVMVENTPGAACGGGLIGAITGTISQNAATFSGTVAVTQTVMRSADRYLGGVVGMTQLLGSGYTYALSGLEFAGKFVSYASAASGGILGYNSSASTANVTVESCTVRGPLTGSYTDNPVQFYLPSVAGTENKAGGLVGYSVGRGTLTIQNIQNLAVSFSTETNATSTRGMNQIGGVIGRSDDTALLVNGIGMGTAATQPADADRPLFMEVRGRINSDNGNSATYGGVGGIAGFLLNPTGRSKIFTRCYTTMDAKVTPSSGNNNVYYGGIVGRVRATTAANASTNTGTLQLQYDYHRNSTLARVTSYTNTSNAVMTVGGLVGAINGTAATASYVKNCEVSNFRVGCDGFFGGIVGIALSSDSSNLNNIQDCRVDGLTQTMTTATYSALGFIKTGGIIPYLSGGTVKNCVVENTSFSYLTEAANGAANYQPFVGGIVGNMDSAAVVENCVANVTVRVGTTASSGRPVVVGGIAAYVGKAGLFTSATDTATVQKCMGILDFATVDAVTLLPTYAYADGVLTQNSETVALLNAAAEKGYYYVGGIAGVSSNTSSNSTNTIQACLSAGNIEATQHTSRQNLLGGLMGWSDASTLIDGCFSNCSLYGEITDGVGGLAGFNKNNLTVTNSHFGGLLRNPFSGGIMGYMQSTAALGTTAQPLTYNRITAPNDGVTKVSSTNYNVKSVTANVYPFSATDVAGFGASETVSALQQAYYAAATKELVQFDAAAAENHVFAVLDRDIYVGSGSAAGGDSSITLSQTNGTALLPNADHTYTILPAPSASTPVTTQTVVYRTAVSGSTAQIVRKALFVSRPYGHDTENGKINADTGYDGSYVFGKTGDLSVLQQYTAAGGAFVGSQFKLSADFAETVSRPIGLIDSSLTFVPADDNAFCGSFDGAGHTLSITKTDSAAPVEGLFGYAFTGSFGNLNVVYQDKVSLSASTYAGGLIGYADFCSVNQVNVTAVGGWQSNNTAESYTGGLIGYSRSTPVQTSSFIGGVTAQRYVGGLVGYAHAGRRPINCFRWHSETGSSSNDEPGIPQVAPLLTTCYVCGDVKGGLDVNNARPAGGLIGMANNPQWNTIKDCFVLGNVTGSQYVGGAIGMISSADVTNVINQVSVRGNIYATDYAGGLIGFTNVTSVAGGKVAIQNAYFVGQIECSGIGGAAAGNYVNVGNFYFDQQLGGNLPVYGTKSGNTDVALTGEQLAAKNITGFSTETAGGIITGNLLTANNTVNNKTYTAADGAILTLSPGVSNYNSGSPASAGALTIDAANKRFVYKNNTSVKSVSTLSFNGNYVNLEDWLTGGSGPFDVYIDGQKLLFTGASTGTVNFGTNGTTNNWYSQTMTLQNGTATVEGINTEDNKGSYSCYVNGTNTSGASMNISAKTLKVTFSSAGAHTLEIRNAPSAKSSYTTFCGFTYGDTSEGMVRQTYPVLTAFATNAVALAAVKRNYVFGIDGTNNAYALQNDHQVFVYPPDNGTDTVKAGSIRNLLGETQTALTDIQITTGTSPLNYHNQNSDGGEFYLRAVYEAAALRNYPLVIDTHIVVSPFDGAGTESDPYQIPNVTVLLRFRNYINHVFSGQGQYFRLTMGEETAEHNLGGYVYDLSDTTQNAAGTWNTCIGTSTMPFSGNFDGNGKLITNMSITAPTLSDVYHAGLFGYVASGYIHDLTVEGGVTVTQTASRNTYGGMLAGYLQSSTVQNVTVRSNGTSMADGVAGFTYQTALNGCNYSFDNNDAVKAVGGAIGYATGNISVDGVLVEMSTLGFQHTKNAAVEEFNMSVGGLLGSAGTLRYETMVFDHCLVYADVRNNTAAASARRNSVGGLMGQTVVADTTSSVLVSNSATYGSIHGINGNMGGLIGRGAPMNENKDATFLNLLNCYSTMDIYASGGVDTTRIGGLYGQLVTSYYGRCDATNVAYGGMITMYRVGSAIRSAGGLIGDPGGGDTAGFRSYSNVAYDVTKNYDLLPYGISGKQADDTVKQATYAMLTADYRYVSPDYGTLSFGHAANRTRADQLLLGQTIAVGVVRTSPSFLGTTQTYAAENWKASSTYVRYAGATLTGNTSANATYTAGNRRLVSTATDTAALTTVRVVLMNGGTDQLNGYGKQLTYYPSIEDTGRRDASYLAANPSGDGLTDGTNSFNIYNFDQLYGLAAIVSGQATTNGVADDSGAFLDAAVYGESVASLNLAGKTIYLKNDLVYATANFLNAAAYDGIAIGTAATAAFGGTLDGENHTIQKHNLTYTAASGGEAGGLFGYTDGAVLRNVGLTDAVIRYTGAPSAGVFRMGSFVGSAVNTTLSGVFSTLRLEQSNTAAQNMLVGGLVGATDGTTVVDTAYFTGSVGLQATSSKSYGAFGGTAGFYTGGVVGKISGGTTTFKNDYVAAYLHGTTDTTSAVGSFVGYNGGAAVFAGGYFDDNTGAADSSTFVGAGNAPTGNYITLHETLKNQSITGFVSESGLYPIIAGFAAAAAKTAPVIASVIPVSFSNAASSLSRAQLAYTGSAFLNDAAGTTYSEALIPVSYPYVLPDAMTLTRNNNGLASVLVSYNGASRLVMMNLECWYDNYTLDGTTKIYTLKSLAEFEEFTKLMKYGDTEEFIGHTHSADKHNPADQVDATFANAIVKLGNDIVFNSYTEGEAVYYITPAADTADIAFKGVFDGNGHVFVNPAFAGNATTDASLGLFGYVDAAGRLTNIGITGTTRIDIAADATGITAGVVAGTNAGSVSGCYNSSAVLVHHQMTAGTVNVGGIVGTNQATIQYVYNMGHITAAVDGMTIGGIAGVNDGSIAQAYNTGILTGYLDSTVRNYVCQTTMAGIAASGAGSVQHAYNAAVLENYKADAYHPIANAGTLTDVHVDGQHFSLNYTFKQTMSGTAYDTRGTTVWSTAVLSGGTLPGALDAAVWQASTGYYPQFRLFTESGDENDRQASAVSSLAAVTANTESTESSFDAFTGITLYHYQTPYAIGYLLNRAGNQGTFLDRTQTGDVNAVFEAAKKGTAVIQLYRENGSAKFLRECVFTGEETYEVNYKVDFSELVSNAAESSWRTSPVAAGTDTFLLNADHTIAAETKQYGNGTAGKPYLINTADDLDRLAEYINNSRTGGENRYFQLASDIAYSNTKEWTPIGTPPASFSGTPDENGSDFTGLFRGHFIGSGYTISGIKTMASGLKYLGLFGYVDTMGSVELVALQDCLFKMTEAPQDGHNGYTGKLWVGALAAACRGTVRNCYSRSVVETYTIQSGTLYAGGLVGELCGGNLVDCYARPFGQIVETNFTPATANTLRSFVQNRAGQTYYAGILAGYSTGYISNCYQTAVYFTPSAYTNLADQSILLGYNGEGGKVQHCTYNSSFWPSTAQKIYNDVSGGITVSDGVITGLTTAAMQTGEAAGVTNGVANDGAAVTLSRGGYLGSYESAPMVPHAAITALADYANRYQNDNFPMLTGFDLLQYQFKSFSTSNLLLSIYNIDSSEAKLMNILASYENYDFPVLATVLAKTKLRVTLNNLPTNLNYNVSAVAYGKHTTVTPDGASTEEIKWTIMNGRYTQNNGLAEGTNAHGQDMMTAYDGQINVVTTNLDSNTELMPENTERIYLYVTILPEQPAQGDIWGVHHAWDSSSLQEILDDE